MLGFQPSIRLRLTLVYGGLFLAAGALLLILNYGLVERSVPRPVVARVERGRAIYEGDFSVPLEPAPEFRDAFIESAESYRSDVLDQLVVQSAIALGLMAVVSVGLGWVVAGRVLQPLNDITATARRLGESNLHERIALEGPRDELKDLADTFDAMLERLDAAFDSQRRFIANASHELRTPLAIERTLIDVVLANPDASTAELRETAEKVRATSLRMERLIDSLLLLARSEREVEAREVVDLADAVEDAIRQVSVDAEARQIRIDRALSAAPVTGDRPLIERMAANLVENAVVHNQEGGWVSVATRTDGARAWLSVTNSGAVVAPEAVEALFEPFRRLNPDRTGSDRGAGLGLSIVRAVARAHGGTAEARALPAGGLEVSVSLPRQ